MTTRDPDDRIRRHVEYVCEPTDADHEIIDPWHYKREAQAHKAAPRLFSTFPEAAYVDVARTIRHGSPNGGDVGDYTYEYIRRYYRDGRVVALHTERGLTPVEVM